MKKNNLIAVIVSLVMVLCVSFGITWLCLDRHKTFTPVDSVNAGLTEGMKMHEIAELYVDSCVTIHVEATSPLGTRRGSMGSGVAIAGNGYQTQLEYKASKGSYFATNYHVVSLACDSLYEKYSHSIYIQPYQSERLYDAELLWFSKDFDLAVLYCDDDLKMDWIEMKDRSVACNEEDKLKFDALFTLGTPLDSQYQNTYSEGRVKNLNLSLSSATVTEVYMYTTANGQFAYTTDKKYAETIPFKQNEQSQVVFDNIYEDVVMMSCDITNGNSGGGVFDEKGYLVGLATLGLGYESANTSAMNFFVPIYPITLNLDKLIVNNETGANEAIFSPESMGLKVIDANEVNAFTSIDSDTMEEVNRVNYGGQDYYYYDGEFYSVSEYRNAFSFTGDGVCIVRNQGPYEILIKGFSLTGANRQGEEKVEFKDRNDFLYYLLKCNKGDVVNFYGKIGMLTRTFTITL